MPDANNMFCYKIYRCRSCKQEEKTLFTAKIYMQEKTICQLYLNTKGKRKRKKGTGVKKEKNIPPNNKILSEREK